MYESFFGFAKRPFLTVPTLDRYFPSSSVEQAYQSASRAIQRAEGPVAIFGGTGLGKTMCCMRIADSFLKHFEVVTLASSQIITRRALLQSLLYELRMPYRDMSEGELRLTLLNRLQPSVENPTEGLVLIVDEAQTLSTKLLDELRLLTNAVRNGVPRVRLVLCGSMRLEEILSHPHMESLNQRLAARCYLTPLGIEETSRYVTHKVELSGVSISDAMTRDALEAIFRGSDGIPRLIDQLADQALLFGASERVRPVTSALVGRAWCMLQQLPNPWSEPELMPKSTAPRFSTTVSTAKSPDPFVASSASLVFTEPPGPQTVSTSIEFGELDDADPTPLSNVPSLGDLPLESNPASYVANEEELTAEPAVNQPDVAPNLLSVFSNDFDEEFSIPVQSSTSYRAYSGMAYGNLNHDVNHLQSLASSDGIDEAEQFVEASRSTPRVDLVSNLSPEQMQEVESQIEDEMRELVSNYNLSAMTMDVDRSIQVDYVADSSEDTNIAGAELYNREVSPSRLHHAETPSLSFSGLHESSSLDRSAMGDDRDLLVIEEDIANLSKSTQAKSHLTSRASLHPYAQLFAKLRQS